tara:strand:+ start:150957 stop:153713 length:2757 start_codon:yes stop_codon:yes gene_type:complete
LFPGFYTVAFQPEHGSENFIIKNYSRSNVLPTNTWTDIHVSNDGILFIAGIEGLMVHDGFNWDLLSVDTQQELLTNRIHSILETTDGHIYVQDQANHVYYFNNRHKLEVLLNPENGLPLEISNAGIWGGERIYMVEKDQIFVFRGAMLEEELALEGISEIWDVYKNKGQVLLLTTTGMYTYENGELNPLKFDNEVINLNTFSRFEVVKEDLRIISSSGSLCYKLKEKQFCEKHKIKFSEDIEILNVKSVSRYLEEYLISTSGGFYVQNDSGIYPYSDSKKGIRFESEMTTTSGSFLVGADGIWIGDDKMFTPEYEIVDVATDGESLWFTTAQNGLYKIAGNYFSHYSGKEVRNSYAIVEDEEHSTIWIGSFDEGLSKINADGTIKTFTTSNSKLNTNTIRSLYIKRDGTLLVSGWGYAPMELRGDELAPVPGLENFTWLTTNVAEGMYEEENGTLWFGTLDGLIRYEEELPSYYKDKNGNSIEGVTKILSPDNDQSLFLCTIRNGIVILDEDEFHFVSKKGERFSQNVRDIYFQSPDTLWAATYDYGLIRYILGENYSIARSTTFGKEVGLPSSGFHRIIEDEGQLWISSNDGLIMASLEELIDWAEKKVMPSGIRVFKEEDGLENNEFNGGAQNTGFKSADGTIWFANQSGAVNFNPDKFTKKKVQPESFYIRSISNGIEVQEFPVADTIETDNRYPVEIAYAHINITDNNTPGIWYQINNANWIKSNKTGTIQLSEEHSEFSTINFANAPGDETIYTLHLRHFNTGGRVPFYLFITAMILGVAGLLGYLAYSSKIRKIGTEHEGEEPKSDFDTIELVINENFTNENFNLEMLSRKTGMSRSKVYRVWKEKREESLNDSILAKRLSYAIEILTCEDCNITETAHRSGFSSQSYFSKVFKKYYGMSPSAYVKKREEDS